MDRLHLQSGVGFPQMVSVLSGKGGVGKSLVAFNLAERLSSRGLRVLLVDADFACGNQHVLANVAADYGIEQFASGGLSLKEASYPLAAGLDLLASVRRGDPFDTAAVAAAAILCRRLRDEAAGYDLIVIDHGSGVSKAATVVAHASDLNVLVVVPELTSLADAGGLFKFLLQADRALVSGLLINRVEDEAEADYVRTKFSAVCERFFGATPQPLGVVAEDESFRQSLAQQRPLAEVAPNSLACKQLTDLAATLCGLLGLAPVARPLSSLNEIKSHQATADTRE